MFNYVFLCRPDQAVFNGEDEDHLNSRDLSDEPWRRQVITNLAKHVLFSKGNLKTMMHKQFLVQWVIFFYFFSQAFEGGRLGKIDVYVGSADM